MAKTIDNSDDTIDSRDVIARIETLQSEVDDQREHYGLLWDEDEDHQENWTRDTYIADSMRETHQDEIDELNVLLALQEEAEGSADWLHGEVLIRDSYFTQYIESIIDECYDLDKVINSSEWPYRHIELDIEAAADEAKSDYTEVDFDGVSYWIRS